MLTLFSQYFVPKNSKRRAEIDLCFAKNIENPLVDQFIIFFESEKDMELIEDHPKVIKKLQSKRMTYGFWLEETNRLPIGTLSILINSDIYLNESIQYLIVHRKYIQEHKKFIALSRYNPDGSGIRLNEDPHWTQDTWALVRPAEGVPSELVQEASFELGHPGCDNKIAYVMHSYGFGVTNPCDFVQTIHLQADMRRAYDARSNKLLGIHAFVHPTLTVEENSKLEFDLLSRNLEPIEHLRINNWINGTKDYNLRVKADEIAALGFEKKNINAIHKPPLDIIDTKKDDFKITRTYEWIKREAFDVNKYFLTHQYSPQYCIYEDHEFYYFFDLYWPSVRRLSRQIFVQPNIDLVDTCKLFCSGFLPTVLEIDDLVIGLSKKFEDDTLFWQMPAKTELDALERHYQISSPFIENKTVHTYIGLPWASFIDQYKFHPNLKDRAIPSALIGLFGARIRTARNILASFGMTLQTHTVCQQIYWQDIDEVFLQAGITDLWLAHKVKGIDIHKRMKLHAWPLFAVNVKDPERQYGLKETPIEHRTYLASFVGAHMGHYITDIRIRIAKYLSALDGYYIKIRDMWHFNDLVYNKQINLEVNDFKNENENENENSLYEYNRVLSNSQFSLCPLGAGLNTLRLWESLAIGSIPVILADGYELPVVENTNGQLIDWNDCLFHLPEKKIDLLDQQLKKIDESQKIRMSISAMHAYNASLYKLCFGKLTELDKSISSLSNLKMCIYIPYYGEKDKYFWRKTPHGLYDLVMDWHQKGWCNVVHHNGPYYWIGGIGEILLFDRDQVADLDDKKRGTPRWKGEVSYKYGFFCNEYNLENDRNFKLEYWSYKPIELENLVLETTPNNYSDRTIGSIFLGSIENETQEYFRNKFADWGHYIEEYYVADKLNKNEKNKYSFDQYLKKVSLSKFGVCFRGNGPKCYREIEYASLGTVLIITEGVDTNYPDPLIEGVHYFLAKNKEDIARIVQETSQEQWNYMSKSVRGWYIKNFTSKNMFMKLQKLVNQLDLTLRKPKTVFIEPGLKDEYLITKESIKIFNPSIEIVEDPIKNISGITIKSGDVTINEFPYMNSMIKYEYLCNYKKINELFDYLLNSPLLKFKRLATLLRLRLNNYKILLVKDKTTINPSNFITNDGLLKIVDDNINFRIESSYDYQRKLSIKYLENVFTGASPIIFPKIRILKANIRYKIREEVFEEDLTDRYSEYISINNSLVSNDQIFRTFKLWELEADSYLEFTVEGINGEEKFRLTNTEFK